MNKGEVYYVSKDSEASYGKYVISPGRPAIIVSAGNISSIENTVTVVYLTSKPKTASPSHFVTHCGGVTGTALCETISTVDKSQCGKFIGKLSDREMEQLNNALRATFGLDDIVPYASTEELTSLKAEVERYKRQIAAYKTLLFDHEV